MIRSCLFALALLISGSCLAQGIEFFHGSWEEVLAEAQKEDKLVFVDAYTSWCGPCKRMSKNVFPQAEVGDFYNSRFINYKLDMEKGEGPQFQREYGVRSYPTLLFIDGDGEVVLKTVGAKQVDGLIAIGKKAEKQNDQSDKYLTLYEEGDRSYNTYYKLVKSLNRIGEPSLRYANEYLNNHDDFSNPENVKFLYEALTRVDSDLLDLYVKHEKEIIGLKGEEAYRQKLYTAAMNTAEVAIEYESEELIWDAQKIMKKYCKSEAAKYNYKSSILYSRAIRDRAAYVDATRVYAQKEIKNDARLYHLLAKDLIDQWPDYSEAINLAEELSFKAAQNSGSAEHHYYLGYVQMLGDKEEKALATLHEALKIAKEEGSNDVRIRVLIQQIEEKA